jgi:hypothetical protein
MYQSFYNFEKLPKQHINLFNYNTVYNKYREHWGEKYNVDAFEKEVVKAANRPDIYWNEMDFGEGVEEDDRFGFLLREAVEDGLFLDFLAKFIGVMKGNDFDDFEKLPSQTATIWNYQKVYSGYRAFWKDAGGNVEAFEERVVKENEPDWDEIDLEDHFESLLEGTLHVGTFRTLIQNFINAMRIDIEEVPHEENMPPKTQERRRQNAFGTAKTARKKRYKTGKRKGPKKGKSRSRRRRKVTKKRAPRKSTKKRAPRKSTKKRALRKEH